MEPEPVLFHTSDDAGLGIILRAVLYLTFFIRKLFNGSE